MKYAISSLMEGPEPEDLEEKARRRAAEIEAEKIHEEYIQTLAEYAIALADAKYVDFLDALDCIPTKKYLRLVRIVEEYNA
ncbi:MAG: hypothetical protein LUF68_06005 [Clostridiales bacterium]|nr:hypothetical protein [Clostridiales bacterium]